MRVIINIVVISPLAFAFKIRITRHVMNGSGVHWGGSLGGGFTGRGVHWGVHWEGGSLGGVNWGR